MSFPKFPSKLPLSDPTLSAAERQAEDAFLDAVQGNILKGHGRDHQRLVFFCFPSDPKQARQLCAAAARYDNDRHMRRWVKSAAEQRGQRQVHYQAWQYQQAMSKSTWVEPAGWERERIKGFLEADKTQYYSGLFLSRSGLAALAISQTEIAGLHSALDRGMAAGMQGTLMGASADPGLWEEPYTFDYHGVFLVASDDPGTLDGTVVPELVTWCTQRGATVWSQPQYIEQGTTWRDDSDPYGTGYKPPREPFGFVDGISIPRFFHEERETVTTRPGGGAGPAAHACIDLQLDNVFATSGPWIGSSYVALLKLEQDVDKFHRYEAGIVAHLENTCGLTAALARDLAPALIMGRNRAGHTPAEVMGQIALPTPPAAKPTQPPRMPAWLNEFNFQDAAQSARCPFHAHIRKSNPRDTTADVGGPAEVGRVQPVRRGMVVDRANLLAGKEAGTVADWPKEGEGVGLLFLAYMADPWAQFDQLHNSWAHDPAFPPPHADNMDPVLYGHNKAWCPHDPTKPALPPMPPVVKRLGGAYLLAPAVLWLQDLATRPYP